jgi:ParB-like chromosome segregation protein Spo0J
MPEFHHAKDCAAASARQTLRGRIALFWFQNHVIDFRFSCQVEDLTLHPADVVAPAKSIQPIIFAEPHVYPGTGADAGKYLIVSGVTRYLAAQSLGWEALTARVDASLESASALALVRASRTHNDTVRETDLDHAYMKKLQEEEGCDQDGIIAALSARDLSRLQAFFDLPFAILELAESKPEKFSASFAELFRKFKSEIGAEKLRAFAKQVLDEDCSLRETARRLEQEVARQKRGKRARRQRSLDVLVRGQPVGKLKVLVTPDRKWKIQLQATLEATDGEVLNEQLEAMLLQFMERETQDAQKAGLESVTS